MVPDKALEIDFNEITLGDMMWWDSLGEGVFTPAKAAGLGQFLINVSNWTEADVRHIRLSEMKQIGGLIRGQMQEEEDEAVPPPLGPPSASGPEESDEKSLPGLEPSKSPSSGESLPMSLGN